MTDTLLDADSFEEQSWENVSEGYSNSIAQGGAGQGEAPPPTTATNKKRMHAELTPLQEDEYMNTNDDNNNTNVGVGRMTRARARAQQQHPQQPGIGQEDSFEIPGLMSTRRGGPPNKMARRK